MNKAYELGRRANEFAQDCRERAMMDMPKLVLVTPFPQYNRRTKFNRINHPLHGMWPLRNT